MTLRKGKIIVWSMLIIFLINMAFLSLLLIFNNLPKLKEEADAAYTFTNSAISEATYNQYSEFHINSYEGFKYFAISCRHILASNMGLSYRAGFTYASKTVKLINDITIPSDANPDTLHDLILYSFSGVFDGQGHSIIYYYFIGNTYKYFSKR